MPLTDSQKEIITASIPFLEANGVELTAKFYASMLEDYPEVRPFFNKSNQITKKQPKILAFALLKYAENINDLTPLLGFVRQIVEKHVGLQVTPEQYDIVGTVLLKTLAGMLGEAATPEFLKAWEVAYFDLANILIQLEKERYQEVIESENAWKGFKDATISALVQETETIKSVYIKVDDGEYAKPFPGQYITLRFSTDGGATVQSREYSLSSEFTKDYKCYRISVRRISGGVASNYIHDHLSVGDQIKISAPYGKLLEPYLKRSSEQDKSKKPIVFFIAGIGITPSVSLVDFFLQKGNKVTLMLSNSTVDERVFGTWLENSLNKYKNLQVEEFISKTSPTHSSLSTDNEEQYHMHPHRLTSKDLEFVTSENAQEYDYYLIGPIGYMKLVSENLVSKGVDAAVINTEQFGPVAV